MFLDHFESREETINITAEDRSAATKLAERLVETVGKKTPVLQGVLASAIAFTTFFEDALSMVDDAKCAICGEDLERPGEFSFSQPGHGGVHTKCWVSLQDLDLNDATVLDKVVERTEFLLSLGLQAVIIALESKNLVLIDKLGKQVAETWIKINDHMEMVAGRKPMGEAANQ